MSIDSPTTDPSAGAADTVDTAETAAPSAPPVALRLLLESDPHQTRVAVLEDDRLTEIYMERVKSRGVVGNVYKGRVSRILPGMQAAFVDIGLARDAFLFAGDIPRHPVGSRRAGRGRPPDT